MSDLHFVGKINTKAIIERDGKILICRDAEHDHGGMWDLLGGRMHFGEIPEQALAREVQEEAGVAIDVHELIFTEQMKHIGDPAPHLFMTYRATLRDPKASLKVPSEELAEALWVDAETIKQYKLYPNCVTPVAKYFSGR